MSRSLPSPPLATVPFAQITAMLGEMEGVTDLTPKAWFERARHEADLAVLAERKNKKEEMFLAYSRACQAYGNAKMHPDFGTVKSADSSWAGRVKDFKPTYDAFLHKAKELKEDLKKRPVETGGPPAPLAPPKPTRMPSGPDVAAGGSIADRMKALGMRGMDTGAAPKRASRDFSQPQHSSSSAGPSRQLVTGGAGNLGPARMASTSSRSRSGSTSTSESTTSSNRKRRPSVPVKPHLPSTPQGVEPPDEIQHIPPAKTGSSTRSRASTGALEPTKELHTTPPTLSPAHSGSHQPASDPAFASSPPRPLPTIPPPSQSMGIIPPFERQEPDPPPRPIGPPSPNRENGIDDFEKNFPSLSEFGKQFDAEEPPTLPQAPVSGLPSSSRQPAVDLLGSPGDDAAPSFPDVPNFPSLPSVPSHRPGLPPPPSRPDSLKPDPPKGPRPPSPDAHHNFKRPASTANIAEMKEDLIPPGDPPTPAYTNMASPATSSRSPLPHPPTRSPAVNGNHMDQPSPTLTFPVAKPTPKVSDPPPKPKFPFSNSIDPNTLRSYFLNPSVNMILLDARPEEEFQRGYVGQEYEPRGATVRVVWMDPTVLMRQDMTSSKLEDSLSLSPEPQRKAFEDRNKADLVVVYDSHSVSWPRKGSPPTPLSKLWDIIYEHEFAKRLERTPVMLTGGYEAWTEFIKMRATRHMNGLSVSKAPSSQKSLNGLPSGPRQARSGSLGESAKRANRDLPVYQSSQYAKNITDSFAYGHGPQSMTGETSYTGHQASSSRHHASPLPLRSPPSSQSSYQAHAIAPPPPASIHPGPGSRRKSDYVEQHNQPYSGYSPQARSSFDYPQAHALAPPPPAQTHALERYDPRPNVVRSGSIRGLDLVARDSGDVRYWDDVSLGLTGLKNLGATCYMNSTIQCLSATYPFARLFLDGAYKKMINVNNPLGTRGVLAKAFGDLLHALWEEQYHFLTPKTFRASITAFATQFTATNEQHDSQEFLSFVLDGLHEDLNRVLHKPPPVEMTPEREHALETLPPEVASEKEWQIYRMRDDSFIVDLFQGQYRNRLECLTCHKTSTTYDAFMYISLPIPPGKNKLVVQELIDEFVETEIMDKADAWNCPRCKVPRRAAKTLTIARLPPVLLIQLKRFTTRDGIFWDRSDANIVFPLKNLDLTRYIPPRPRTGREDTGDPRTQLAPYKYDLYAVSNHMGTLSSGHYTAYVKSSKGWMFCEDSKIGHANEKDIVSRQAYILFYKRVRA